MVKIVVLKAEDISLKPELVGTWLDESHYHTLVEEDMDLYLPPTCSLDISTVDSCLKDCSNCESGLNEHNIIFKFRKNFFSKENLDSAYDGLKDAARITQNRGTAAGPRGEKQGNRDWVTKFNIEILRHFKSPKINVFGEDPIDIIIKKYKGDNSSPNGGVVWLLESVNKHNFEFDSWIEATRLLPEHEAVKQANWVEDNLISKSNFSNSVNSGIAGWYDRYPRIPYGRATTYTRDYPEMFAKSYPFLQTLSKAFQELLPWRYGNQKAESNKVDPKFVVPGTPFTTVTVNKNFRTAAHYDPANMPDGFANISVISKKGDFSGGYLVFPEIGYAVNIRPSDLLFVNNQAGLHGNTELILDNPEAERISAIAFFHENMTSLGSYDYEMARMEFVQNRKANVDHPKQRRLWNGISPGMWGDSIEKDYSYKNAKEWYDHLKAMGSIGEDWLDKYHSSMKSYFEPKDRSGLSDFF